MEGQQVRRALELCMYIILMKSLRMKDSIVFSQKQTEFLAKAAKRYIWWMTKEEAMLDPFFVMSQVMNLGDIYDSAELFCIFDHKILRQVLQKAKAGWFATKEHGGLGITFYSPNTTLLHRLCRFERFRIGKIYDSFQAAFRNPSGRAAMDLSTT